MLTRKLICVLIASLCLYLTTTAQDKPNIKFGKVTLQDFDVKSPLIDSSTEAIVVADVGKSVFSTDANEQSFFLLFKQKKRIKILHKNGFKAATIIIPLYVSDNGEEQLIDLDAYTYNIENGKVVDSKVEKSSVFTEKRSKNWVYKKFTFPAVKEGSIIEYSYEVKSGFLFNLQSWTFQGEYPVLWSQYNADIPEFFKYVTLSQGYQPFFIKKNQRGNVSFNFTERLEREPGARGAVSSTFNNFKLEGYQEQNTWVMKDVPALKDESFTTTLQNAVSKLEFQLNQIAYPNSVPKNYLDSWEKVAKDLNEDERFGLQIYRPNNWLDDDVNGLVKNAGSQKEKAQKIFEHVRDNFAFNDRYSMYTSSGLRDVFKNKNGSVADINMLLIAMLKTQKIDAIPVILSTRDHGYTHEFYPLLNRYNYLIAKVQVDNETFYLDATSRLLAFGLLPNRIYNGQAREISNLTASPVLFSADSLKETNMTTVFISNTDKQGLEGSFSQQMGVYRSQILRQALAKSSMDEFRKSVQSQYPEEITVSNLRVDSLKIIKHPVALNFDLNFKPLDEEVVYFSPMMGEAIKKNPFSAAERLYPVEMPNAKDEIYVLYMEVPKGYKVDELPKSIRLKFNENEGMFEYLISVEDNNIQMRSRLQFRKATFSSEDYQSLRDFYAFVVKKQAEQIVFKKIR